MPFNRKERNFYDEVDKERFRAHWSCVVVWFFVIAVIAAAAWLIVPRYL